MASRIPVRGSPPVAPIMGRVRFPITSPRTLVSRRSLRTDGVTGLCPGSRGAPDGLAIGLLAGVNPVAGLYGCLFGPVGGALFLGAPSGQVPSARSLGLWAP